MDVREEILECRWLIRWLEQRIIELCACITALHTRITELEAKKRDK